MPGWPPQILHCSLTQSPESGRPYQHPQRLHTSKNQEVMARYNLAASVRGQTNLADSER